MRRFAVIGLGRFGSRLASNLAARGQEVIAVDIDPRLVEEVRDYVTLAVALDATDEQALRMQGIDQVDVAVVGIGSDFEASALTTVVLRQIGVKRVISRAITPVSGKILAKIGADEVVNPEDESADRWTNRLLTPQFLKQTELSAEHSLVEVRTPEKWVGKTLIQINARAQLGLHVVGIKRLAEKSDKEEDRQFELPDPSAPLFENDVLVIVGHDKALAKLPKPPEEPAKPAEPLE